MDDDTRFKDLTLPEDEPWMSHGFISKIAAQVSLPYRKPKGGVKEIERRNGSLVVPIWRGPSIPFRVRCARLMNAIAPCMGTSRNHCSDTQKSKLTKK